MWICIWHIYKISLCPKSENAVFRIRIQVMRSPLVQSRLVSKRRAELLAD
jgi:hypothetical protein